MTALRDTLARLKAAYAQIKPGRIEDAWVNDDETLAQMNFGDDLREAFPQIAAALDRAQRVEEAIDALAVYGTPDHPAGVTIAVGLHVRFGSARDAIEHALAQPDEKESKDG